MSTTLTSEYYENNKTILIGPKTQTIPNLVAEPLISTTSNSNVLYSDFLQDISSYGQSLFEGFYILYYQQSGTYYNTLSLNNISSVFSSDILPVNTTFRNNIANIIIRKDQLPVNVNQSTYLVIGIKDIIANKFIPCIGLSIVDNNDVINPLFVDYECTTTISFSFNFSSEIIPIREDYLDERESLISDFQNNNLRDMRDTYPTYSDGIDKCLSDINKRTSYTGSQGFSGTIPKLQL